VLPVFFGALNVSSRAIGAGWPVSVSVTVAGALVDVPSLAV